VNRHRAALSQQIDNSLIAGFRSWIHGQARIVNAGEHWNYTAAAIFDN
jgi:hypothetical protein